MEDQEMWKPIAGYENSYQVSSLGRLRSLDRKTRAKTGYYILKGKLLKYKLDKYGYPHIGLSKQGKYKWFTIHRLVATAFHENPENLPQVNHKNGIKIDNRVENLEWISGKGNIEHACKNGLRGKPRIENSNLAKLDWVIVDKVRKEYNKQICGYTELSKRYNIPESTLYKIITNRTWRK